MNDAVLLFDYFYNRAVDYTRLTSLTKRPVLDNEANGSAAPSEEPKQK